MTEIRALTVQQPWAFAIAAGAKTIENRTRGMNYRGLLAIHAGLRWSDRGQVSPLIHEVWKDAKLPRAHAVRHPETGAWVHDVPHRDHAVYGAVIAVAELVDSHPDGGCCRPWGESAYDEHGGRRRTAIHHLVLENICALAEPVPCKGSLGLWRPTEADTAAILGQMPAGAGERRG